MAIRNDMEDPALVPCDDFFTGKDKLYRKPEEMDDYQFELLAAAWAEEGLDNEGLEEIEKIFTVSPAKKARAEAYKKLRLKPFREKWEGRNSVLKTIPAAGIIRKSIFISLAAAAAVLALFVTGSLLKMNAPDPEPLPVASTTSPAMILQPTPVKVHDQVNAPPETVLAKQAAAIQSIAQIMEPDRLSAVEINHSIESARLIAMVPSASLSPVEIRQLPVTLSEAFDETNWIMRGIAKVSTLITKEDKPVDTYFLADACVRGLNSVLGWEMELRKVSSPEGEPVSINFSSSLLSFSSPVKKSSERP